MRIFTAIATILLVALLGAVLYSRARTAGLAPAERPLTSADHIIGSLSAPVKLVVYTDLSCPYCQRFHEYGIPDLQKAFGSKITIIYRNHPLIEHPGARTKAEAAECVAQIRGEAAYWKFVDANFADPTTAQKGSDTDAIITKSLAAADSDTVAVRSCMRSHGAVARVNADIADAASVAAVVTPTLLVEGKSARYKVDGYYFQQIRAAIQALLK